jgi:branched-chain amino acid transport system permease protein
MMPKNGIGRDAAIFLGKAELQQPAADGLLVEVARELLGLVPAVDVGHDLAVDEAADGGPEGLSALPYRTGLAGTPSGRRGGKVSFQTIEQRIRALTELNSRSYCRDEVAIDCPFCRGWKLVIFLQLTLNGLAVGCIYGLVALGFVLIYKATELVQLRPGRPAHAGRLRLLHGGRLVGPRLLVGFLIAVVAVGAFGALLDRIVLRQVIGQPQFAVVMLTIGSARCSAPSPASPGARRSTLCRRRLAASGRSAGVTLSHQYLLDRVRHPGAVRRALRLLQPHPHRRRDAGDLAEPARRLLHGHPGEADLLADLGDLGRRRAAAGILLAPVTLIDINMGLAVALKAFAAAVLGGFGSIPGRWSAAS